MPNYDAGHYFLTVMAPLDRDAFVEIDGVRWSAIDQVRDLLTRLPTAQQDPDSLDSGLNSPFAAVPGTHFARFFIIDDPRYNGRRPTNPILDLLFRRQMTEPQEIDQMPHAYLVLCVDFDAPDGSADSLRRYTDAMWEGMSGTLQWVYAHCTGFDAVWDAGSFYDFVAQGQIKTSLPFNDYWSFHPPQPSPLPALIGVSALVVIGAAALWPLWSPGLLGGVVLTLIELVGANLAVILYYGLRPYPPAPDSDLGSILKALYVQQKFVGFAIDHLASRDTALAQAFDSFCETHRPGDRDGPHQPAGTLRTRWDGR